MTPRRQPGLCDEGAHVLIWMRSSSPAACYTLPRSWLRMAAAAAVSALLMLGFIIVERHYLRGSMEELRHLRRTTAEQQARIEELTQRAASLQERVHTLEAQEREVREWLRREGARPHPGPAQPASSTVDARVSSLASRGGERPVLAMGGDLNAITEALDRVEESLDERETSFEEVRNLAAETVDYLRARPLIWPVAGPVTSPFGVRRSPITGRRSMHLGVDIGAPLGTPIVATGDGVVEFTGFNAGLGRHVVLYHGHGIRTVYAHNRRNLVRPGQRVERGQVIAQVGNTGASTGPHVHYEILINGRHVDPWRYHLAEQRRAGR